MYAHIRIVGILCSTIEYTRMDHLKRQDGARILCSAISCHLPMHRMPSVSCSRNCLGSIDPHDRPMANLSAVKLRHARHCIRGVNNTYVVPTM